MKDAHAALVLVGKDSHNRKWVDEEVRYCTSAAKPVLWARLPNTTGGPPPELAAKPSVTFAPKDIRDALETALGIKKKS
jgi:hypothetical protein